MAKTPQKKTPSDTPGGLDRPQVSRYTDFRAYLRDMIAYLKATRRGFSYRMFALEAGFSSPSFLKLVADGQRNLSPESVDRVVKGLRLERREAELFEALVELGQAETDERRDRAWTRIARLAQRDPVTRLQREQFEVYARWYPFVIRELATLPGFSEDAAALSKRMRFPVKPEDVQRALTQLEGVGLLVRGEDGALRPAEKNLTSGPEVRTLAVRSFHRQMIRNAELALEAIPPDERNVTGVTVPLTRTQYQRVTELAQAFRREVLAIADGDDAGERREVHHLVMALIPLTKEPRS